MDETTMRQGGSLQGSLEKTEPGSRVESGTGPQRTGPQRTGPQRTGPQRTGPQRTVRIPASSEHEGLYFVIVTLDWLCPVCGGPRGEPHGTFSYDGSRRLWCHGWENPCGHVDTYRDLREEAKRRALAKEAAAREVATSPALHRYLVTRGGDAGAPAEPAETIEAPTIWLAFAAVVEPLETFEHARAEGTEHHLRGLVDGIRVDIEFIETGRTEPALMAKDVVPASPAEQGT